MNYLILLAALTAPIEDPKTQSEMYRICERSITHQDLSTSLNDLITGITEPHFDHRFVAKIVEIGKKTPNGEYVEHWENGQVKMRGAFKNGLPEGHIHGWYSDGADAFKLFYRGGKKIGIQMSFYPSGPRVYGLARIIVLDDEGKLNGEQKAKYLPGDLKEYLRYKNGKLDGEFIIYKSEGKPLGIWEYKDGILITQK